MRTLARSAALVLILAMTALAQPGSPAPFAAESPALSVAPAQTPPPEQPAQPARRNLFLAPARVREAQSGRTAQGQPATTVPSVPLPPPPSLLPPIPSLPQPLPGTPAPAQPPQGSQQKPAPPELLGVLGGPRPQAILARDGDVVTAGVGDRTPWGTIVRIADGLVVLRTPVGPMTLRVALQGVR